MASNADARDNAASNADARNNAASKADALNKAASKSRLLLNFSKGLRLVQFAFAAIVLGLTAWFYSQHGHDSLDPRELNILELLDTLELLTIITAGLSLVTCPFLLYRSLTRPAPPNQSLMIWNYPIDLILLILWFIAFGMQVNLFNRSKCGTASDLGRLLFGWGSWCPTGRTLLAFTFLSGFSWFLTFLQGIERFHGLLYRRVQAPRRASAEDIELADRSATRPTDRGPDRESDIGPARESDRGPANDSDRGPANDSDRGPARDPYRSFAGGPYGSLDRVLERGPNRSRDRGPDRSPDRGPDKDPERGPHKGTTGSATGGEGSGASGSASSVYD